MARAQAPTAEKTGRVKQVQDLLRAEDSTSLRGSLGAFLSGLVICTVAGVAFAVVARLAVGSLTDRYPLGYLAWFGIFWAVLVAALYLTAPKGGRGGYVVASLNENIPDAAAAGPEGSKVPAFLNPLLAGPRRLTNGLAGLRGKWTARQNAMFKRTAQMVLEMARYDGAVEVRSLMHPPEDMGLFNAATIWLDRHDYTGKSSDGQRMWITSIGRKKLTDGGVAYKMDKM